MDDDDWTLPAAPGGGGGGDEPPDDPEPGAGPPEPVGARFRLTRQVGRGASGVVYEAVDEQLQTPVAVKIIRITHHLPADADFERPPPDHRFRHPALVRVLARGRWDGGIWLAMEWVDGWPLADLITWSHDDARAAHTRPSVIPVAGAGRAPLRALQPLELVRLLHEAALCIGSAHDQGLVHLDLKPDNLMVERRDDLPRESPHQAGVWFGDSPDGIRLMPRVIDWGLGRDVAPEVARQIGRRLSVYGAPAYLAPERAAGDPAGIQPPADVYALGAILYHMLTGRRPFGAMHRVDVLDHLRRGEAPEDPSHGADPLLIDFCAVCRRAMDPDPRRRYRDGHAFAVALRRARAIFELRRAQPIGDRARDFERQADALEAQADDLRRNVEKHDASGWKAIWAVEDRIADRRDEATRREAEWLQVVRHVLAYEPDLPAGRAALIDWRCTLIARYERRGEHAAARLEFQTLKAGVERFHQDIPPPHGPKTRERLARAQAIVQGTSRLTLCTAPGVDRAVARCALVDRRWQPGPFEPLGSGHLGYHGRLIVRLAAPGFETVDYPVHLRRGEHLVVRRPGDAQPTAIALPPAGGIRGGEAYVAGGWCVIGGERHGVDVISPAVRIWVDGFVMQTDPVTHGGWIEFLDALVADGRADEAAARVPGGPAASAAHLRSPAVPTYRLTEAGYVLEANSRGGAPAAPVDELYGWPVSAITRDDALAYCAWRAGVDGLPWRLPSEWEFEKAARCSDDRRFPWGVELVPPWTRIVGSTSGPYLPAPVSQPTHDVTVHGIRWTVGNMLTWCLEAWTDPVPAADAALDLPRAIAGAAGDGLRMLRGGSFTTPEYIASGAGRFAMGPGDRSANAGLRLVRSWPVGPDAEGP